MRPQRHPELGGERAEAASQRCPVDERSRSRLRDRDGGRLGIDDEIGVLRLLAEPPVEPVRELRRAHRAEPVGDVDVLGGAEAGVAQEPLAGACVERDVERRVEERPGTEIAPVTRSTPRGPISRIGRATRACAAGSAAAAASSRVIPPTSTPPIVVPAGIVLRSDSATPPRAAATSTTMPASDERRPAAGGAACAPAWATRERCPTPG